MEKEKKLIRVWGRIRILETSAVGIPVYPAAHKSFSLIKALRETEEPIGEQLNTEGKMTEEESEKTDDSGLSESETTETKEETEESASEEKSEESKEESKDEDESVEKSIGPNEIAEAIKKGVMAAVKEAQTQRGFVEPEVDVQKQIKEELDKKSIGELAIMSGLFQKPRVMGDSQEIEKW